MLIKRVSWYKVQEQKFGQYYNNKNLHSYSPYCKNSAGQIVIDSDWWQCLLPYCREKILLLIEKIVLDKVDVPHAIVTDSWANDIDEIYLNSFDYHVWYKSDITNGPSNVSRIKLDKEQRQQILNNDFQSVVEFSSDLCYPIFARLSGTSGKNSIELKPLENVNDLCTFLRLNKKVRIELQKEKETYLVLMPWQNEIKPRYEFRIFVYNRKVTAVSQQDWFELYEYDNEEIQMICGAINNADFINDLPYECFVADVWINENSKTLHLIECNPFGAYSPTGSALFNWIDDFEQLYGKKQAEFRFVSLIKDD